MIDCELRVAKTLIDCRLRELTWDLSYCSAVPNAGLEGALRPTWLRIPRRRTTGCRLATRSRNMGSRFVISTPHSLRGRICSRETLPSRAVGRLHHCSRRVDTAAMCCAGSCWPAAAWWPAHWRSQTAWCAQGARMIISVCAPTSAGMRRRFILVHLRCSRRLRPRPAWSRRSSPAASADRSACATCAASRPGALADRQRGAPQAQRR